MKDNKLEVGDKLVAVKCYPYGGTKDFRYDEVERVTKTLAITKQGCKIKIMGSMDRFDKVIKWGNTPFSYHEPDWQLVAPEILEEEKQYKELRKIQRWFDNKKFTDEEKKQIYNLLNKDNE